jgi:tetratricopeptide (TPR) repeat protein
MHARLARLLLAVAVSAPLTAASAFAQSPPQAQPPQSAPPQAQPPQAQPPQAPGDEPAGNWMRGPEKLPKVARGDKTKNLDFLFEALKAAPDADAAKLVEGRIWAIWFHSGSDTAELLMNRVKTAVDGKDVELGIRLLDAIVELKPDYVEAWNRRATLHFLNKDFAKAIADIRQVLAREPRHFGALSGLGIIFQEIGEEKFALDAFRRALAVNPHLQKIPDFVKTLTEKVEGRDI